MIPPEDGEALRPANLERDKEGYSLDGVIPSINIISHEQIVGVRARASDAEEFHQVMELPVYVAAYRDGTSL